MKMPHSFIREHPESEPLTEKVCHPILLNEYMANDAERAITSAGTVVYDYVDMSPHYDNTALDLYIDEKDLIELPAPSQ